MKCRVITAFLVGLAAIACSPPVWGSTLSVASQTSYTIKPYTGAPSDITAAGNVDWVVIDYGEKAGATAIVTMNGGDSGLLETGPYNEWNAGNGYPTFNWTDSFWIQKPDPLNPANAGLQAANPWNDTGERVGTHIAIPAGSGQLTVWWVYAIAGGVPTFTTSFQDGASLLVTGGLDARTTVVDYSTDTDQTLSFSMNRNAGIFALAVSHQVPEPSTLALLGLGLAGTSICVWRRRK